MVMSQIDEEVKLSPSLFTSDADLYFTKLQFEERVKFALRYEFDFESPLTFVRRFFESAFAPEDRVEGPIEDW